MPKPLREVFAAALITCFILLFIKLAVDNLLNGQAIIASILWLLLVASVLSVGCRFEGHRFIIDILGAYSLRHFIGADLRTAVRLKFASATAFLAVAYIM